jgi:hypothetical protein
LIFERLNLAGPGVTDIRIIREYPTGTGRFQHARHRLTAYRGPAPQLFRADPHSSLNHQGCIVRAGRSNRKQAGQSHLARRERAGRLRTRRCWLGRLCVCQCHNTQTSALEALTRSQHHGAAVRPSISREMRGKPSRRVRFFVGICRPCSGCPCRGGNANGSSALLRLARERADRPDRRASGSVACLGPCQ